VFHDPSAPVRILRELDAELDARGFRSVADAIGFAHKSPQQQAAVRGGVSQPVSAGVLG
jgi:dihydroorotate dehydrogenase (NAD+) catalytic subunit